MRADPGYCLKVFFPSFHKNRKIKISNHIKVHVEVDVCCTGMMKAQTLVNCFAMAVVKDRVCL